MILHQLICRGPIILGHGVRKKDPILAGLHYWLGLHHKMFDNRTCMLQQKFVGKIATFCRLLILTHDTAMCRL